MIKQQTNQQKQYNMQAVVNQPQKTSPPIKKRSSGDERLIKQPPATTGPSAQQAAASAIRRPTAASQQQLRPAKKSSSSFVVDGGQHSGSRLDAADLASLSLSQRQSGRLIHFRFVRSFQQEGKTVFEMQIAPDSELGSPWMVYHRFNEFRTLHEQLAAHFEALEGAPTEAPTQHVTQSSTKTGKKSKKVQGKGGAAADTLSAQSSSVSDASSVRMSQKRSAAKFVLPKFQNQLKALFGQFMSIERRMRFLQEYMNGLISLNEAPQVKLLFKCTLFEDFIGIINRNETKRKLLKRLSEQEEQASALPSQPQIRKSLSSNFLNAHDAKQYEESKRPAGTFISTKAAEEPPKDNNERVERLLTKLDNASKLTDIEHQQRELRYLDEFDLISDAYNEDQIGRMFRGNGLDQKGLLQQINNPRLASPTLKLLARIFNQEKNMGFRTFEQVLHKQPKALLVNCNFGQFFGNGNLAEEKSVILIVDCYNGRQANQMRNKQPTFGSRTEQPPINVFSNEADYDYFCTIYQRWKDRRERTVGVLEPTEAKTKLNLRKNDSFSSFSSVSGTIPKNRSGFFTRNSSTLDLNGNPSFQSECHTPQKKNSKRNDDKFSSQFKQREDEVRCSNSSSSKSNKSGSPSSSASSSSQSYFSNYSGVDAEVDAISEGDNHTLEETKYGQRHETSQDDDSSTGEVKFAPKRNKKLTPLKRPSKQIDLKSLLAEDACDDRPNRIRSNSLKVQIQTVDEKDSSNSNKKSEIAATGAAIEKSDSEDIPEFGKKPRKMTEDASKLSYMSEEERLDRLRVPNITTSSQQSSHSTTNYNKKFKAPSDLDMQVLSWIQDYRKRDSALFEDMLYQSPPFALGQLATVILKKSKTKRLSRLGKNVSDTKDSISLCNLVAYIEDNLSSEAANIYGLQVQLVQNLSLNQKIIEIEVSSDAPTFKSLSAQNLTTPLTSGFSSQQAAFRKQKQEVKPKTRKRVKHRFLLSYLWNEQEFFVTLFLINNKANCINTDIVVILSQPLQAENRGAKSLPVVPENARLEDQDDQSPQFIPNYKAKQNVAMMDKLIIPSQTIQMNSEQSAEQFEELFKSRRMAAQADIRTGPFGALAATETEREIVEPALHQPQHTTIPANLGGAKSGQALMASTIRPVQSSEEIYLTTLAGGSKHAVMEAQESALDKILPPCAGEITLKVQVKYHKTFLKLLKQILQAVVLEQHLY